MRNANISCAKEEAQSQIGNTNKTKEIYRRISKWPKSKPSKEVIGRNDFVDERGKNIGFKWIDIVGDYLSGNHGPKEENR